MQAAKEAVSGFLHHGNKHTVDIDQETKPAVLKERVAAREHEDVTTAVDREVHQHHHQTHVQPVKHKVVEEEKHHHNVIPIEHKQHHHGKDAEVERTLADQHGAFRDEREVLPTESSRSERVVMGEHTHHHIHDVIQPVVEQETIQPHVVHTTVPVHEHIEHEPVIHKGNVLPHMTMDQFTGAGHSLTGHKKAPEHIEYEGDPLKIDGKSHVGFGRELTGANVAPNRAEEIGSQGYTHGHGQGVRGERGNLDNLTSNDDVNRAPRTMGDNTTNTTTSGVTPHKSNLLNKLDPRIDADEVQRNRV